MEEVEAVRGAWGHSRILCDQVAARVEEQRIALGIGRPDGGWNAEHIEVMIAQTEEVEHQRSAARRSSDDTRTVRIETLSELRAGITPRIELAVGEDTIVLPRESLALVVFRRSSQVGAAVHEVLAGQRADAVIVVVTALGDAVLSVDVDALIIVLEDDVDGARDGVRTIDR